jgi:hypothetical protein
METASSITGRNSEHSLDRDFCGFKNDTTEWNIALRRATANKARVDDRTGLRTAVERDVDA